MFTISTASDDSYVPHLATMLVSLNEVLDFKIDVFILDYGISETNLKKLKKFFNKLDNLSVRLHKFSLVEDKIKSKNSLFSKTISAVFFQSYLGINTNRVFVIDADLIFTSSPSGLDSFYMENKPLAAVPDMLLTFSNLAPKIFENTKDLYFNGGVLLVDLYEWNRMNINKKSVELLDLQKQDFFFFEQDLLNIVLKGNWNALELKYNYIDGFGSMIPKRNVETFNRLNKKPPVIVHFAGPYKPWHYSSVSKYRKQYFCFRQQTPWAISKNKYLLFRFLNLPLIFVNYIGFPMWFWRFLYRNDFHQSGFYKMSRLIRRMFFR